MKADQASADFWRGKSALMLSPLLLTIVFAKVSIPPLSTMGLGVALPILLSITLLGIVAGQFELHPGRLYFYLILVIWVGVTQLFGKSFSITSVLFLSVLYFPYVLRIKEPKAVCRRTQAQEVFCNVGFILAIAGCCQYAGQFLLGAQIAFPIEHLLPKGVLIERFNYLNPLHYGSKIYKSNGIFFLEPSFFSQFLAVSLLVELANKSRFLRIGVHLAAMVCTFSGTGLIVLGFGALTLVTVRRRWDLVVLAFVVGLLSVLLADSLKLSIFLDRSTEFANVGTSGFERFVAWTYMLEDQYWDIASRVWTGFGAGTFEAQQRVARYSVMEISFAKIIFEFGLPGAALYFGFLIYCLSASPISASIKVGLFVCVLMNGSYSESIAGIFLSLVLWPSLSASGSTSMPLKPPERDLPRHKQRLQTAR